MTDPTKDDMARNGWFWGRVINLDGCWLWPRVTKDGRCSCVRDRRRAKTLSAHRLAWELACGGVIPRGMGVRRTCKSLACVRPSHMELYEHDFTEAGFWARVLKQPGGCWNWTGALDRNGYPIARNRVTEGKQMSAAMVVWRISGMKEAGVLRRECGNRLCVNPAHMIPSSARAKPKKRKRVK